MMNKSQKKDKARKKEGSHEFNREFLVPMFEKNNWPDFQGAIIMDTIIDFNDTKDSQDWPDKWQEAAPETYEAIVKNDRKGDFLNIFYRHEAEGKLANMMKLHNQDLSNSKVFPNDDMIAERSRFNYLELGLDMPTLPPPVQELAKFGEFIRSDHARFWYSVEKGYISSLRSVLLTDTGPYRGAMRECYHNVCDTAENGQKKHFANYDFFAKTVQLVIDTITDMSQAVCTKSKRASQVPRYSKVTPTEWKFGSLHNITEGESEEEYYGSSTSYTLIEDNDNEEESSKLEEIFEDNAGKVLEEKSTVEDVPEVPKSSLNEIIVVDTTTTTTTTETSATEATTTASSSSKFSFFPFNIPVFPDVLRYFGAP